MCVMYRCDAEPGALAEYILALLKHNVPENEMRKELSSQLEEFLEKGAHYWCNLYLSF
jgi:RNA-binding protein 26